MSNFPPEVQEKIVKYKGDGFSVAALTLAGVKYVYRSINREEFRNLQEQMATEAEKVKAETDALKKGLKDDSPEMAAINSKLEKEALAIRDRGEERLVKQGLIYPEVGPNTPAGVFTTIADYIMQTSGFGVDTEPEIL